MSIFDENFYGLYVSSSTTRVAPKKTENKEKKAKIKKLIRDKLAEHPKVQEFLQSEKAEGKFIRNLVEVLQETSEQWHIIKLNNVFRNDSDVINRAFAWSETKEGHEYWQKKNRKL